MIIKPYTHTKAHRGTPYDTDHEQVQGLVAWYRLAAGRGGIAYDEIGGNHGILANMANPATPTSGWGAGKFGSALNFDGNDYVDVTGESIKFNSPALTVTFWMNATTTPAGRAILARWGSDQAWVFDWSSKPRFIARQSEVNKIASWTGDFNTGQWHFVVGCWDGVNVKISLDGKPYEVGDACTSIDSVSDQLRIGQFSNESSNGFVGILDDLRIYNRAIEQPLTGRIINDGFAMFKRRVFFDVAVGVAFVPQVIGPY